MKKLISDTQKLNTRIDVRTIGAEKTKLSLSATDEERQALAQRFDVPEIKMLTAEGDLFREDDLLVFEGVLCAKQQRICVVSLEPFVERMKEPFRLVFSEKSSLQSDDFDIDEDVVFPVVRGKIDLGEALAEEYGVLLNAFPRKTDDFFEYRDEESANNTVENPFSCLKELLNKK